ncbi:Aconitate hydratase, mitochondrial [Fusarium keratoplasticum]|uniref:Aconitate hydratase, mitochondrial n=1 Tax=Fusarium keratoplasticum TaxID=1328300 RepID=A0ACC0QRJ4_9HYPO|nr:Aconitate hydratase, mitochondrial [Fusarium keratoplasticum]KAI8665778.1 Aconitate hydratase, mitochondrial [Fusarium keratoplasticum]
MLRASRTRAGSAVRSFATVNRARGQAPLSRFEPDHSVDYVGFLDKLPRLREILDRPLTYAEKVLLAHLDEGHEGKVIRGSTQLKLRPRRIACQDATAQMAIIQFMTAGLDKTAVPTTVHCDHLIVGRDGSQKDLAGALASHGEVYEFMSSACQRYNMGFWKPNAGIIHQIVLENYAYPGGMLIGTDSHTPNAGGMGMIAVGVGGADAVDVMSGLPLEITAPNVVGVKLMGQLSGWASPKDVINKVAGILGVKGGTGNIIEYFGPGAATISASGMASITNMGAETGATTSLFPYSDAMSAYLRATRRPELAEAVQVAKHELRADEGAEYDRIIEIDLSTLEPRINGPFTPDLSTPISKFGQAARENQWPEKLTAGLIGSCTNSSFEDLSRAASLAQQALDAGLKPKMPLLLSPGSEQTNQTLKREGVIDVFERLGSKVLSNACGPCCGSWDRTEMKKGTPNSILASYNRNFTGRLDGNPATHAFLSSPEMVMAKVFSDDLGFDPVRDSLVTESGDEFRFQPPRGDALPADAYENADHVYEAPSTDAQFRQTVTVQISPDSQRLQRLAPFRPWSGKDFHECPILIKTAGKCTTDHITTAGPWMRFRGHLENISNNTLIGAVNADNNQVNKVVNQITGEQGGVPDTARDYQQRGLPWVVVADHNYGEGSSREHAALQPRYLGGVAIIARSFARIHEANLKKQGMLALTFADDTAYDRIKASDRVSIVGLADLEPGQTVRLKITSKDGKSWDTEANHTFTREQVEYFRAGSALNVMASRLSDRSSPTASS